MIWLIVWLAAVLVASIALNVLLYRTLDQVTGYWFETMQKGLEAVERLAKVHKPPTRDWVMKQPGVYVIRAHDWTKIGYASNVARRLDDYVVSIPRGYELIAVFYCENPAELERELHYRYQQARRRGEWFSLSDETLAKLQAESEGYKGR